MRVRPVAPRGMHPPQPLWLQPGAPSPTMWSTEPSNLNTPHACWMGLCAPPHIPTFAGQDSPWAGLATHVPSDTRGKCGRQMGTQVTGH